MSDFTKLNRLERVPALNRCSSRVQAVWSHIHHALDRRGYLRLGGADYRAVLVRRLAIDSADRQFFYAAFRALEQAGLLVVEGDVLVLRGHAGAPREDVTSGLPPADLPLASDGPAPDLGTTSARPSVDLSATSVGSSTDLRGTSGGPPGDLSSGSARDDSISLRERREEKREKREDQSPSSLRSEGARAPEEGRTGDGSGSPPLATSEPSYDPMLGVPPPLAPSPEPEGPGPREVRQVLAAFERAWHAHTGRRLGLRQHAETQRAIELWRWGLEERPAAPLEVIAEAAGCACADPKFRSSKRPWLDLVAQPGRYLPARPGPAAARPEPLCVQVFRRLWERRHGSTWEGPRPGNGDAPEVIDTWAMGAAHQVGATPEEVITASIRRWSKDAWVEEHGHPWRAWAIGYAEAFRPEDLEPAEPAIAGGAPC